MNKELFLQHQQQLIDQLNLNIKAVKAITYEDFLRASEQAKADGHEDHDGTALLCLFLPASSLIYPN